MNGVNLDLLSCAINKNDEYYSSAKSNGDNLLLYMNELNSLYNGVGIEFLFKDILSATKDVRLVSSIINDYSDTLVGVKKSYFGQDENIKIATERIALKNKI